MLFLSFRNALIAGAMVAASATVAAPAFAGVTVDFGFVPLGGTITYTPDGAVSGATTISGLASIPSYFVNTVGLDDTSGVAIASFPAVNWADPITFTLGNQALAHSVTQTFTGTGGTYSALFTQLFAEATPGSTSLTWVLEGTLTPPSSLSDPTQPIFLSTAFTNITSSNAASTNVSFTETSNPPSIIPTPEPASLALLGVGMLAVGVIRRRRA